MEVIKQINGISVGKYTNTLNQTNVDPSLNQTLPEDKQTINAFDCGFKRVKTPKFHIMYRLLTLWNK